VVAVDVDALICVHRLLHPVDGWGPNADQTCQHPPYGWVSGRL